MSAWPSSICTVRRSAPWLSRCVAKRVRRQRHRDSGRERVRLDQLPEHLPRHRAAARGDEERIARLAGEDRGARVAQIALEPAARLLAERDEALLRALAGDMQGALAERHADRLQ